MGAQRFEPYDARHFSRIEWGWRLADSAELAGRQAGVLAVSQAKLAKRKHTASRLRSTTTMTTSVCVLLSVMDRCA